MTTDPVELLALAEPLAHEVGDRLRASLAGDGPAVSAKSTPTDLVSELDLWAERHLVERLLAARPDDGVQGEEGADRSGTSGVTWCIDPIDGTINFLHHLPGFNVSVAALVDGQAVAGVVVAPLTGETFTAVRGRGAHVDGTPLCCSSPPSLARSVVGTGFAYDPARRTRQAEVVAQVIGRIADIRRLGAAATDLCLVAAGRLDAYWEVGLNPWDHAAGGLIAEEAGARVGAISGGPASATSVLAAPPELWDDLAALLLAAGAERV